LSLSDVQDVNIIYVGTLHPSHYNHARAALEAGKHCLVEKPATLNAAEWNSLSAIAKEKNLFLMEGESKACPELT
jgi:dihydrodiol dehydrogenase / D-xylose 1-dehydrogenase (NADP)